MVPRSQCPTPSPRSPSRRNHPPGALELRCWLDPNHVERDMLPPCDQGQEQGQGLGQGRWAKGLNYWDKASIGCVAGEGSFEKNITHLMEFHSKESRLKICRMRCCIVSRGRGSNYQNGVGRGGRDAGGILTLFIVLYQTRTKFNITGPESLAFFGVCLHNSF